MNIAIVSKYPAVGQKHTEDGALQSYTRNLVEALNTSNKIIVFAEKLSNLPFEETDGRTQVKRVWDKKAFFWWQILRCLTNNRIDVCHIQHEFFLYGGALSAVAFPLLLVGIRILRIKSVVTLHGIVPLNAVNRDFVVRNGSSLPPFLIKFFFKSLTKLIYKLSNQIIVHEKKFSQFLQDGYGIVGDKCQVIPHGIEIVKEIPEHSSAIQKIGIKNKKIILLFGYITGYKGIDLMLDAFALIHKRRDDCCLLIVGGEHPRHREQPAYQNYLDQLYDKGRAISSNDVQFTGFVSDQELSNYFAAARIVVFPYTIGMASSGAMALAISHHAPFIVSPAFSDIVEDPDMVFDLEPKVLARMVERILDDDFFHHRLHDFSRRLAAERSWDTVGKATAGIYSRTSGTSSSATN